MSSDDRFCPYKMTVCGGHLVIKSLNSDYVTLRYGLDEFYLQTNDEPFLRTTDPKRKNFCTRLMISNSIGHLRLYFVTFDSMIFSIEKILAAQGLESRKDQYELVERLPDSLVCKRSIVKNVYCNTAKYELKSILKRDKENIHVFLQELSAQQSLQHKAGINKLMDVIEDDDSISLIL